MPSSNSFDRREVVAFLVGLLVVGIAVTVGVVLNSTSDWDPPGPTVDVEVTYHQSNDSVRINHIAGADICANQTYVVIERNDTRATVTRAWVTADSEPRAENGHCREVEVSDSFVLTDADLEPGDRVKVVWKTNRESVHEEHRRKVLTEYVVGAENETGGESATPA